MKIIADKDIYKVAEYFSDYGELQLLPGREISEDHLADADALLIRTVTKINKDLIQNSSLKFVGSASSGKDHVDEALLASMGINFCNAPGCNADAVVNYFFAVLSYIADKDKTYWQKKTVGIIGAGNVGEELARNLLNMGIKVSIFDPLLSQDHDLAGLFCPLEEVMQQDIVTLHTSLSSSGEHATYHMLNKALLLSTKQGGILINAARGEVIDNKLLSEVALSRPDLKIVLDVWEGEPNLYMPLLERVNVATPHIAGYSVNGKLNGTKKVFDEFCQFFGNELNSPEKQSAKQKLELTQLADDENWLNKLILKAYPVTEDFINSYAGKSSQTVSKSFDQRRNNYVFRNEFRDYQIHKESIPEQYLKIVDILGFSII